MAGGTVDLNNAFGGNEPGTQPSPDAAGVPSQESPSNFDVFSPEEVNGYKQTPKASSPLDAASAVELSGIGAVPSVLDNAAASLVPTEFAPEIASQVVSFAPSLRDLTTTVLAGSMNAVGNFAKYGLGMNKTAENIQRASSALKDAAQDYTERRADTQDDLILPEWMHRAIGSSAYSLTQAASVGPAGPYAMIAMAVGDQMSQAEIEATDAGMTGTSKAAYVLAQGVAEGAYSLFMQKIGLGGLEEEFSSLFRDSAKPIIKRGVQDAVKSAVKQFGKTAIEELPEEVATTLTQQVIDMSFGMSQSLFPVDPVTGQRTFNPEAANDLARGVFDTTTATLMSVGFASHLNGLREYRATKQTAKGLRDASAARERAGQAAADQLTVASEKSPDDNSMQDVFTSRNFDDVTTELIETQARLKAQGMSDERIASMPEIQALSIEQNIALRQHIDDSYSAIVDSVSSFTTGDRANAESILQDVYGLYNPNLPTSRAWAAQNLLPAMQSPEITIPEVAKRIQQIHPEATPEQAMQVANQLHQFVHSAIMPTVSNEDMRQAAGKKPAVSETILQQYFPGSKVQAVVRQGVNSAVHVTLPSGTSFEVHEEDSKPLSANEIEGIRSQYGDSVANTPNLRIAGGVSLVMNDGSKVDGVALIRLVSGTYDDTTLTHERVHLAWKLNLFDADEKEKLVERLTRGGKNQVFRVLNSANPSVFRDPSSIEKLFDANGVLTDEGQQELVAYAAQHSPTLMSRIYEKVRAILSSVLHMSWDTVTSHNVLDGLDTEDFWRRARIPNGITSDVESNQLRGADTDYVPRLSSRPIEQIIDPAFKGFSLVNHPMREISAMPIEAQNVLISVGYDDAKKLDAREPGDFAKGQLMPTVGRAEKAASALLLVRPNASSEELATLPGAPRRQWTVTFTNKNGEETKGQFFSNNIVPHYKKNRSGKYVPAFEHALNYANSKPSKAKVNEKLKYAIPTPIPELVSAVKLMMATQPSTTLWYTQNSEKAANELGKNNLKEFQAVAQILSPRKDWDSNVTDALYAMRVYREYTSRHPVTFDKNGVAQGFNRNEFAQALFTHARRDGDVPFVGFWQWQQVARMYATGEIANGTKTGSFGLDFQESGNLEPYWMTVNDVQIARTLGFYQYSSEDKGIIPQIPAGDYSHAYATAVISHVARLAGIMPDQAQAALWRYGQQVLSAQSDKSAGKQWRSPSSLSDEEILSIEQGRNIYRSAYSGTNINSVDSAWDLANAELTALRKVIDKSSTLPQFERARLGVEMARAAQTAKQKQQGKPGILKKNSVVYNQETNRDATSTAMNSGLSEFIVSAISKGGAAIAPDTNPIDTQYHNEVFDGITRKNGERKYVEALARLGLHHYISEEIGAWAGLEDHTELHFFNALPDDAQFAASLFGLLTQQDAVVAKYSPARAMPFNQATFDYLANQSPSMYPVPTITLRKPDGSAWTRDEVTAMHKAINPDDSGDMPNLTTGDGMKAIDFSHFDFGAEDFESKLKSFEPFVEKVVENAKKAFGEGGFSSDFYLYGGYYIEGNLNGEVNTEGEKQDGSETIEQLARRLRVGRSTYNAIAESYGRPTFGTGRPEAREVLWYDLALPLLKTQAKWAALSPRFPTPLWNPNEHESNVPRDFMPSWTREETLKLAQSQGYRVPNPTQDIGPEAAAKRMEKVVVSPRKMLDKNTEFRPQTKGRSIDIRQGDYGANIGDLNAQAPPLEMYQLRAEREYTMRDFNDLPVPEDSVDVMSALVGSNQKFSTPDFVSNQYGKFITPNGELIGDSESAIHDETATEILKKSGKYPRDTQPPNGAARHLLERGAVRAYWPSNAFEISQPLTPQQMQVIEANVIDHAQNSSNPNSREFWIDVTMPSYIENGNPGQQLKKTQFTSVYSARVRNVVKTPEAVRQAMREANETIKGIRQPQRAEFYNPESYQLNTQDESPEVTYANGQLWVKSGASNRPIEFSTLLRSGGYSEKRAAELIVANNSSWNQVPNRRVIYSDPYLTIITPTETQRHIVWDALNNNWANNVEVANAILSSSKYQGESFQLKRGDELANPATDQSARGQVNIMRNWQSSPTPEAREEYESKAATLLADDYDGTRASILQKAQSGQMLDKVETAAAKSIINSEGLNLYASKDQGDRQRLRTFLDAYTAAGTEQARAFQERYDPVIATLNNLLTGKRGTEAQIDLVKKRMGIRGVLPSEQSELEGQLRTLLAQREKEAEELRGKLLGMGLVVTDMATAMQDPAKRARVSRVTAIHKNATWDRVYEAWLSGLLGGPLTHQANILGNFTSGTWELSGQRIAEALLNVVVRDPGAAQLGEFRYIMAAAAPGVVRGLRNALQSWRLEMPMFEDEVGGNTQRIETNGPAIPGSVGRAIRIPLRALQMEDEFFKSAFAQMEASALAYRMAKAEGLKGKFLNQRMTELMSDYSSEAWQGGANFARRVLFQEDSGNVGNAVKAVRRAHPALGYIIPFVQTPLNIVDTGIRKTPLGSLRLMKRAAFDRSYTTSEAVHDAAEQGIAWLATMGLMAALHGEDDDLPLVVGSIPTEPKDAGKRDLAYRLGLAPMTIRLFGKYYSYARIEPFATALATTTDMLNTVKRASTGQELNNVIGDFWSYFKSQLYDKTYGRGLSDVLEALSDASSATKWIGNFATTFIPNYIKQPLRAADPKIRESRTWGTGGDWAERYAKRVVFQALPSQLNPYAPEPKVDLWGREISKTAGMHPATDFLWRALMPVNDYNIADPGQLSTMVDRMILNFNNENPDDTWYPTSPQPYYTKNGEKVWMNDTTYHQFQIAAGTEALHQISISVEAQRSSDPEAFNPAKPKADEMKLIRKAIDRGREIALWKLKNDMVVQGVADMQEFSLQ